MGMETLALNIDRIEKALREAGLDTVYVADEDYTLFIISNNRQTIEVFDAVSGGYWKPENTSEVVRYVGQGFVPVTEEFGTATSEDELVALVKGMFGI